MSDLTPEKRAEIRRRISHRRDLDYEQLPLPFDETTALLDAMDELDRIKAELGDPSRHSIMGGWLVIDTRQHNCGTGPGGHYGAHEPGCGLEQAIQLDNLPGWPGDERARLAAAAERVRALHVGGWGCGNPSHTNPAVSCPDCFMECDSCGEMCPCPTLRALDDRDE